MLQAQVALLLDGMAVFERTIKVSMARGGAGPGVVRSNDPDRVQRTIHVGGLPMEELSETVLADFFQNVGEVQDAQLQLIGALMPTCILAKLLQCMFVHAGLGCEKEWPLCMGGIYFNPGCTSSFDIGRRTAWGKHAQDFTVQNTHTYCWLACTGNSSCISSTKSAPSLPGYR